MNILQFIEDENLLNDQSLSPAQKMALKAVYGLSMTEEESELWDQAAGGRKYIEGVEQEEVSIFKGRKSGGTDKILSNIVLFESCMRPPRLSVGEKAVSMIVTSEMSRQSKVCYDYILGKLERSAVLKKLIKNVRSAEIELSNGCTILIFPCSQARVRAPSILVFGGDEFCFWKTESIDADKLVLDAARPGLIFPNSKMIKLSSVNRMSGEGYYDHRKFFGVDNAPVLVLKGSTSFFYPGFSKTKLAIAKLRDPVAYAQEYECQYRLDEASMYDPVQIDAAVNFSRPVELSFRSNVKNYKFFVDVAGGGGRDSYAIAAASMEGEKIIVDLVRSRKPKFNPDEVTKEYADLIKSYKCFEVTGDKFSGDWASNAFAKYGIKYIRSEKSKSEIYLETEGLLNTGRLELPNKELLIMQLKGLIRKTHSGSRDSVDSGGGEPEDEANVCMGAALLISEKPRYLTKEEQDQKLAGIVTQGGWWRERYRSEMDKAADLKLDLEEEMRKSMGVVCIPEKKKFDPWK